MITPRRLTVLFAVALIIAGAAFWAVTSQHRAEQSEEGGALVLPGLRSVINDVSEVRVIKGDGTRTTLKKGTTDWIVGERNYLADSGRVRKLLLDASDLKVVESKTSDPASYGQLGVEDVSSPKAGGTRLEIVAPAKTYTLIVGKPSGSQSSFVRAAGAAQSVLAAPQVTPDADPRQWLDKSVMDIQEQRVQEVAVQPATGPKYTVTRASAQQPDFTVPNLPKGRELTAPGAADPVASALASLTLDDVRKPGAGTDPAHVTFRTFNGLEVDLTGHKDGDRRFIAVSASATAKDMQSEAQQLNTRFAGWELEIPSYKYDSMFRPLDELLKKPEPPAHAATAKKSGKSTAAKTATQGSK
ncbi:MAG TPA: DUF4340 domain-containing protein [Steroidobacteraceae bacterium]|nr:DUF4340 domain-containing protein [Steroidobacteraceae bacterium]